MHPEPVSRTARNLRFADEDEIFESPIKEAESHTVRSSSFDEFRIRTTSQALEKLKDAEFQHAMDQEIRFEKQLSSQRQWTLALADENHCLLSTIASDHSMIESYAFQVETLLRASKEQKSTINNLEKHHQQEIEVFVLL